MTTTTTDPLAGIPEPDRTCIQENAEWVRRTVFHDANNRRLDGPEGIAEKAYRDAITAAVAAYRAAQPAKPTAAELRTERSRLRALDLGLNTSGLDDAIEAAEEREAAQPAPNEPNCGTCDGSRFLQHENQQPVPCNVCNPETLTREEAETRLLALGHHPHVVDEFLHDAKRHLANNSYLRPGTYDVLRAYVRGLDKQAQATAAPGPVLTPPGFVRNSDGTLVLAEGWERVAKKRADSTAAPVQALDAERKAWAQLLKATVDDRDAGYAIEQENAGAEKWAARTGAELEATKQALRDLGVDVDALMEEM